ncbi:hypothetical protein BGZ67_009818 [Mortierella alpina]|nr:hypothetical protein BGZ67_009818 [Mortierella alpina]
MSQLSSPAGSQQGDSGKKKYRHRKKKHRPVTSALHGKIGVSQTTKPKITPTTQHSPHSVTLDADHHSDSEPVDQAQLKPSDDVSGTPSQDMALPEVSELQLLVEVQTETQTRTQTLLQGSTELVTLLETETMISSARTTDSVLSPVQEAYESGEDESDDSLTLPLPQASATLEDITSDEKAMYPEIECGQRIPESQSIAAPESTSDAFSASFEERDDHFDIFEQTQELDFEELASYPKSQGTPSPPPSASPSSPSSPISPDSPTIPINFKTGSPTLDLGSVSQQSVWEQSPVVASVSKEQSSMSGEESDEQEVWHPSLQSVRSSNGSESPSESRPGPSSMVTLEYDNSDEAPITQAFSQRSESPPVTGTLFSLDKERDPNDRASKDKEVPSGVRINRRSSRARSTSTPETTGVHIPDVTVTRRGRSNVKTTEVAAKGRRLLRHQRTPEPTVEIEAPSRKVESGHSSSPTGSPPRSQSLAFVNIPTATNTRNKDAKNNRAPSKDLDDSEYTAPDELDDGSHNSNSERSESDSSDGHSSDSTEEAFNGATRPGSNGQSFKAHQVFYEATVGAANKPFSSIAKGAQDTEEDEDSTRQGPVDDHEGTTRDDSDDSDNSYATPVLSRKRLRRAPPASSPISTSRARNTRQDTSRVISSSPSLRAASTPDLEMDQVIEDHLADEPEQEAEMTLQSEDNESDDEWDVRRLKRIWKKYSVSWPLRDRRAENEAKKNGTFQFVPEPYSMDFIFGTALPLPKSANMKLFGEV